MGNRSFRVPTGTGKPGKMGAFSSQGILFRLEKSGNFTLNTGEVWKLFKL